MAIDPQLDPFIAGLERAWPEPPLSLPIAVRRARAEKLAAGAKRPYPAGLRVEDKTVLSGPRPVRVRIYRPLSDRPLAALVYAHGGGWVIGSIETHDSFTAALARDASCIVVSVDYARAPEHPFPAALEDYRAVVEWLFDHGSEIGADTSSIVVGGDSAGGNLAAATALALRGGSRRLAGQLLIYPCVDVDFKRPSFISEAQAPFMTAAEMIWFWDQYCPDPESRADPLAVPWSAGDLADLPPAFVVVAEHDCLRDEGAAYAERLRAAGNEVLFRPGQGLIHGFVRARDICAAAGAEHAAMVAWLRARWTDRPDRTAKP